MAQCQVAPRHRDCPFGFLCAQMLQNGLDQEQGETIQVQEARRPIPHLSEPASFGNPDRRAVTMHRQRYDSVLCEGSVLRTDAGHGFVEQRDREPCSFVQARRPNDVHQRPEGFA